MIIILKDKIMINKLFEMKYKKAPHKIKEDELNRINPSFTNVKNIKGLIKGVPYL